MKSLYVLIALLLLLHACSEEENNENLSLVFDYPSLVNPGQLITIKISESNKETFQYNFYVINGPDSEVFDAEGNSVPSRNFEGSYPEDKEFSFSVAEEGSYQFGLSADGIDQGVFDIVVQGCLHLTEASISKMSTIERRVLEGTDYCILEPITIPSESSVSIANEVKIAFGSEGALTIAGSLSVNSNSWFQLDEMGWKGIFIEEGGQLTLHESNLSDGGHTAFDGFEKAFITVGGLLNITGTSNISTGAEGTYGLYFLDTGTAQGPSNRNSRSSISAEMPMSGGMDDYVNLNIRLNGEFSTLKGLGEGVALGSPYGDFFFPGGGKYHFEGSTQFGSVVFFQSAEIYMDQDNALIFNNGVTCQNTLMTGFEGASWKGMYCAGTGGNGNLLLDATIDNAGSSEFVISGNTVAEKASIYVAGAQLTSLNGTTIKNSDSYGIYLSSSATVDNRRHTKNTFDNNAMANIVGPTDLVAKLLAISGSSQEANEYTFTNSAAESIQLLRLKSSGSSRKIVLPDLGQDNYYLVSEDISLVVQDNLSILAGAHFKFAPNTGLAFNQNNLGISAIGTALAPITLEASDATLGWDGAYLSSTVSTNIFRFDYVIFSGGGAESSDDGNVTLNSSTAEFSFTNCTFKDGKGYGVVVESLSNTFDFQDVANNNTFANNTSGDVMDKTIP